MITAAQLRAARALIGIDQRELAERCGLSVPTIQRMEASDGVIRGNYTDTVSGKTQLVQGSVDKKSQRVAFTVGDDATDIVETGLYNLTKDEAPVLVHFSKDKTEQWTLVRLKQPQQAAAQR